jgi:hypothetical protein
MEPIDEESHRIIPVYKRYENQFEPQLWWIAKASLALGLSIYGLVFFHQASSIRPFFWEGIVASWLLLLAVVMFAIWIFFGVLPTKTKSMETEFSERCSVENTFCRELMVFSIKSRQGFLKYLRHYWETEEVRYKTEAAICLALGGILATLSEWTGKPKATYSFLVVVLGLAYVRLLINQKLLAKAKRFVELLERE